MVAIAEPDATLTPALLSPEIQASRRTMPASPGGEPEVRVRIDQPLPAAVELLEQTMVRERARSVARQRREGRAAAGHLQEGTVPEAAPLGPAAPPRLLISLPRAPASPAGCAG